MWGDIAIAFLLAIVTSFVATPYTIKLAKKVNAIDMPSDRRVNKKPIPRIGGIAIILGFLVSSIYLIITMSIEQKIDLEQSNYGMKLLGFLIGIIIIAISALTDDIKDLKPWQKLIMQTIAASIVYFFGIKIDVINNFEIPAIWSFLLTVGWIVGLTNAMNLIDGLDGLSSGISLISCLALLIIFATNYSPAISIVLITALAGGIIGFAPFNIYPAKTFMGDVGAQFLGFALSIISILGVAKTVTLVVLIAPVLVLGLPIFDTLFAIFRRIKKGKSIKAIFKADRGHLHHRLMDAGFTQSQSVTILYGASAAMGMLAIILINEGVQKAVSFALVLVVIIAIGYKGLKNYKNDLIEENIRLGIAEKKPDPEDAEDSEEEKEESKKKENKVSKGKKSKSKKTSKTKKKSK